jgi:hypothetical protein
MIIEIQKLYLQSAWFSRDSWYRSLHGLVVLRALSAHPLPSLPLQHRPNYSKGIYCTIKINYRHSF